MPTSGLVYVITSETCKTSDGKDAKGWLLSYSYNSLGMATRSCYQKYNENIWIWEFSGREYIFPASNFKPAKSQYFHLYEISVCFLNPNYKKAFKFIGL